MRALQDLVVSMKFIFTKGSFSIQIEREQAGLACAQSPNKITDVGVSFLSPLDQSIDSLKHWQHRQHA